MLDYCRGIDRLDVDLVASVYHDDGIDDHGSFCGLGTDFARYAIPRLRDAHEATMHTIGDSIIDFLGDDAALVETYVHAQHRRRDGDGPFIEFFGGRYIDRFERRDGWWKIAHRLVVHEWDKTERVALAFPPGKFTEGRRDRSDPAYGDG